MKNAKNKGSQSMDDVTCARRSRVLTTVLGVLWWCGTANPEHCGLYVQKNHTSVSTRFVFIAGLNGKRVRGFAKVLRERCGPELCVNASLGNIFVTPKGERATRERREAVMVAFRAHAAANEGKLIVIDDLGLYPAEVSTKAMLQHPSLHVVAALAEIAGVDLRIAIVSGIREIKDAREACVVADNAAVLSAQLALVDPAFVARVVDNDLFIDPSRRGIVEFLHPDLPYHEEERGVSREPPQLKVEGTFAAHARPFVDTLEQQPSFVVGKKSFFVQKTVFSNAARFVFVAALEGTGHHACGVFFTGCQRAGLCTKATEATKLLRSSGGSAFVHPSDTNEGRVEARRAELVGLLRDTQRSNDQSLIVLNTLLGAHFSYPSLIGEYRPLNHVDVRQLATLAERSRVDLRVIVLSRPAEDVLTSTTVHRHLGTRRAQSAVLADNAAVLASQLELIDPAFVLCVPYGDLGSFDWWNTPATSPTTARQNEPPLTRAAFLHPAFSRRNVLEAAVENIYSARVINPRGDAQINATDFILRRDIYEGHTAVMADHLYRTAGCHCSD